MKYYIEISLLPDAEIGLGFLWQKVYGQVHLALVEVKDENDRVNIGVSFPKYKAKLFPLGDTLRLFALTPEALTALQLDRWLNRLLDYVVVSDIKEVPTKVEKYARFSRKQVKSNVERLARRQAKRKGISFEEAMKNYEGMDEQTSRLPFIMVKSLSTEQNLKLFIELTLSDVYEESSYNTYGFGTATSLPWF